MHINFEKQKIYMSPVDGIKNINITPFKITNNFLNNWKCFYF